MGSYLNNALIPGWSDYIIAPGQLDYNGNFADISIGHNSRYIPGSGGGHLFTGDIAEMIIYNEALIEAEQIIVANSLSAKYNITIGWDMYAEQSGFTTDVIGVGRETDGQHLISLRGQLKISCSPFSRNGTYIFAGHNNEPISGTTINLPSGYNNRLKRIWYVAPKGIKPATIELSFILPYNPGSNLSEYGLLFSTNSDMSSSVVIMNATSIDINNKTIRFSISPASLIAGFYTLGSTFNHWTAVSGELWNETANWESASVPGNTDNVKIISQPLNNTFPTISSGILANTNNMIIESGAELTINSSNSLTVSGNLSNNAGVSGLMIKSDATGTGSLIVEGTSTGDISVERFIAAWIDDTHGWHFLASPVATFDINGSAFDPGTNDDLYGWDESTGLWMNHKAGDPTQIIPGTGYLTAWQYTDTMSFFGTLNNSNITISNLSFTPATDFTGWHLLGNPYPCALLWDATSWNRSNVNGTAKIWNEINASYTDISQNEAIPAMQALMINVTSGTNSITIPKADRSHNSTSWYKDVEENKIKLTVYDTEGNTAQESNIRINENAITGFDSNFDSWFLAGYAPQFYSVTSDGALSTNTLTEISAETSIPFSFIKNASSTYYIEAEGINNLVPQETVYLTDIKTNHTQILNDNPIYSFTSDEGDVPERFIIPFSPLSINDLPLSQQIIVFSYKNNIEIRSNKPINAKINIYNIACQLISTKQLYNESVFSINLTHYKGTAIVSIITSGQILTKKVIIW